MKRKIFTHFFFWIMAISTVVFVSCGEAQNGKPPGLPYTKNDGPNPSLVEEQGRNIGVTKNQEGHLLVSVPGSMADYEIKFLRILAYFNTEALAEGSGAYYPHKFSGEYTLQTGPRIIDEIHYEVMFASDSFLTPVDLKQLASDLGLQVNNKGNLIVSRGTPYEKVEAILTYLNAQAANEGRTYKFKAGYQSKQERDGVLISDRIDILVYFAEDSAPESTNPESVIVARVNSPAGEKRKEIISRAVVAFSQILEKPEMLTVSMVNLTGRIPHFSGLFHMFDGKAVGELQQVLANKRDLNSSQILGIAETKQRLGTTVPLQASAQRIQEPVRPDEMRIVAHVVEETIRAIRPVNLEIIVYDFNGNAPQNSITWNLAFSLDADTLIKLGNPTPSQIFAYVTITEHIGLTTGNRIIPPRKPVLPSLQPQDSAPETSTSDP